MRDWTDKDGNKRVAAEVVADNVYFGDSKRDGDAPSYGGSYGSAPSYGAPADGGYGAPSQGGYGAPSASPSEFAEIDDVDGELPFYLDTQEKEELKWLWNARTEVPAPASAERFASSAPTSAIGLIIKMQPSCIAIFPSAQDLAPPHHRHLRHAPA